MIDQQVFLNNLNHRPVHAYMLLGPKGAGKRKLAEKMAAVLLHCPQEKATQHPDYVPIQPEKTSIGVDVIRELKTTLAGKPFRAERRVVVIHQANQMTTQAQNSLLKTLEEPVDAVLILLCEQLMLLTINSRCLQIPIRVKSRGEMMQFLREQGIEEKRCAVAAALSGGLEEKAFAWATDEGLFSLRKDTIEGVRRLFAANASTIAMLDFLKENKEQIDEVLDVMASFFRDILLVKEGQTHICNTDYIGSIQNAAAFFTSFQIRSMIESTVQAKKELKANVNYLLAMENLLLEIMEVKKK